MSACRRLLRESTALCQARSLASQLAAVAAATAPADVELQAVAHTVRSWQWQTVTLLRHPSAQRSCMQGAVEPSRTCEDRTVHVLPLKVSFHLQVRVRQAISEQCFREAAAAANHMFAVCHAAMLQVHCDTALPAQHATNPAGHLRHSASPASWCFCPITPQIRLCY